MNILNSKNFLNLFPIFTLFSFFLIKNISSKLLEDQVEIAINCGGPEYINPDGIVYKKVCKGFISTQFIFS